MRAYKYILLDWDGNLAQTLNMWPDALDIELQKRNVYLTRRQLIESCGGFVAYVTRHADISAEDAHSAIKQATEIIKEWLPQVELYPDAIEVLQALKDSGKQLALVTSSEREVVIPLLERFELAHLFDTVVCHYDVENRKPHPEPLLKALEHMHGSPEHALMIGDTHNDIIAGHNAGIDSVLFYPEEHRAFYDLDLLKSHKPTYIVHDFKKILQLVG